MHVDRYMHVDKFVHVDRYVHVDIFVHVDRYMHVDKFVHVDRYLHVDRFVLVDRYVHVPKRKWKLDTPSLWNCIIILIDWLIYSSNMSLYNSIILL